MRRSRKRRSKALYIKFIVLLIIISISIGLIKKVLARYTTTGEAIASVDLAYYLFKEESISQNLKIASILPRARAYEYTFSVANYDGTSRTQTALTYTIAIKTTTNLQLEYSVHKYGESTELIQSAVTQADSDGTYFNYITVAGDEFGFNQNQQNTYVLEVKFPERFNNARYEGILEYIEITVNSSQKTSS